MSSDSRILKNVVDDEMERWQDRSESYKDRIMGELKSLAGDAERLFRQAAETSSDTLSGMRTHFDRRLERTRDRLDRTRRVLSDNAQRSTAAARGYVRERPLRSVAVATITGVAVGLIVVTLLNRRR